MRRRVPWGMITSSMKPREAATNAIGLARDDRDLGHGRLGEGEE